MRTTIELSDRLRARLLEASARRREKGFSHLVEAAVEAYLDALDERRRLAEAALATFGSIADEDATALEAVVARSRESWRSS